MKTKSLSLAAFLFSAALLQAQTVTWTNGTGNGLASDAGNWSDTLTSSSIVTLDSTSTANITWDAGAIQTVAGWNQTNDYTGTVSFNTTHASFDNTFTKFTITGDATVTRGTWTHQAQGVTVASGAERYLLNMDIGGNFTLASTASINVVGRGFAKDTSGGTNIGGSHGGRGEDNSLSAYGSILSPNLPGGGGRSGSDGTAKAGSGTVILTVTGAMTVDGTVTATGQSTDGTADGWRRAGAGGSIQLTADSLSGAGSILAAGGDGKNATNSRGGGGGRIAMTLGNDDFDSFSGTINARAGNAGQGGTPLAGVGSIMLSGTDGDSLIFDNFDTFAAGATAHYALLTNEDFSNANVQLQNRGYLELDVTRDLFSLTLDDESQLNLTNSSMTTVQSLAINGFTFNPRATAYDSTELGSQVFGDGTIMVIPEPGTLVLLGVAGLSILLFHRRG